MCTNELRRWLLVALPFVLLFTIGSEVAVCAESDKVPPVMLTAGHAACCLVGVGDAMPTPTLPDLDGNPHKTTALAGKQGTVVVLWNSDNAMTHTMLGDLRADVQERFGASGVAIMGVAIGLDAAAAKQHLGKATLDFPVLLDQDGTAFARIGKEMLPRVYVLGAEGTIVWFDIEYSRATRRELQQTLRAMTR